MSNVESCYPKNFKDMQDNKISKYGFKILYLKFEILKIENYFV